jgi:hypothetical protein
LEKDSIFVGYVTIGKILNALGYSKQINQKMLQIGDSAVLCVETDENLMALSLAAPEAWWGMPRVRLVRTIYAAALCTFVRETWGGRRFRRVTVLRLSGGWQLAPQVYDALADALRRDITVDWGNAMTVIKLGRRYIRNVIRNLPRIPLSPPLEALRFGKAPVPAAAKNNEPVRTDPALKGYRDLFEREFSGGGFSRESRFRDINGPGLPLGLKSLSLEEAIAALRDRGPGLPESPAGKAPRPRAEAAAVMRDFILRERDALANLREILSGSVPLAAARLETRLDEADYLWAHFPECAGAEGRRPGAGDISFLKRVRVEIEPFLELWDLALHGMN